MKKFDIINNMYKYRQIFHNFFWVSLFLGLFPFLAFAQAKLLVTPSLGTYQVGELFSVLVNVDSGNQPINASSAHLNFDNQKLEVASIGYSQSIFNIWTEEPSFSNAAGSIKFSGGLPNPGFTGKSGSILRVTFKTTGVGQAPISFVTGSVLANDGRGTNILDSLNGGVYSVVSGDGKRREDVVPTKLKKEETTPIETKEKQIEVPIITDWPRSIEEGINLAIKGLGAPNARVLISVQKGSEDPIIYESFSGSDGRFIFTYPKTTEAGFYRIWAKNSLPTGATSSSSEAVVIEITKPLFFRIGTIALNFTSIIVSLLALILFLILIIGWIWLRFRKWQKSQGKEINEAEHILHESFDKLKIGLKHYVKYLTKGKTQKSIERREEATEEQLEEELENIEKGIEKEIKDIEHPPKK